MAEMPKWLTPKQGTLRQLFLLLGNNCGIPGCKNVIIEAEGAIVGNQSHQFVMKLKFGLLDQCRTR